MTTLAPVSRILLTSALLAHVFKKAIEARWHFPASPLEVSFG